MTNVLPGAHTILARRTRARFIIVIGLTLSAVALVAILALLPAFISISIARAGLASDAAAAAPAEQAEAARTLALTQTLETFVATTSPSTTFIDALALQPQGVSVTSVRYSAGAAASLILSGTSEGREGVSAYRDALVSDGGFGKVSVPVAALAGTQQGRFSITLSDI
jgi:hypothetical protein